MYLISKAIYFLLNPITWIFAIFLWALLTKVDGRRLKLLRIGVFTFLFFSFTPIFQFCVWAWEIPLTDMRKMEKTYDIGVVLGGYSDDSIQPNDRLHVISTSSRLTTSIELYKKGIIRKILLTGGTFSMDGKKISEAEKVSKFLLDLGIPEADILIEKRSLNTRENAIFSQELLVEKEPNASVLLITSAWHMRRSRACFKKAGLSFDTFSTDPFEAKILTSYAYYFFPNTTVLEGWRSLLKEWFGFTVYKIIGYA